MTRSTHLGWVKFHSHTGSQQFSIRYSVIVAQLQRSIAIVLSAAIATGCSRTTTIPRDNFDDPKYQKRGSYRIRVSDETVYLARTFAVTDTTIVINDLSPHSPPNEKREMPIVLSRSDVTSIEKIEPRTWPYVALGFVAVLLIVAELALSEEDTITLD